MEDMLIKKIKGGLMGMRTGSKTPQEVAVWLNKLKAINPHMYSDFFNDYKATLEQIK